MSPNVSVAVSVCVFALGCSVFSSVGFGSRDNNNNTLALMINHQRQIICVVDGCEVSKHFSGNNNS